VATRTASNCVRRRRRRAVAGMFAVRSSTRANARASAERRGDVVGSGARYCGYVLPVVRCPSRLEFQAAEGAVARLYGASPNIFPCAACYSACRGEYAPLSLRCCQGGRFQPRFVPPACRPQRRAARAMRRPYDRSREGVKGGRSLRLYGKRMVRYIVHDVERLIFAQCAR